MPLEAPSSPVIWVGPSHGVAYAAVLAALCKKGMPINLCPSLGNLMNALDVRAHPVVVACDERKRHRALSVVAMLSKAATRVPVVVLAEEVHFGDYYYLTNHGALGYFQVGEDPEHICRAIALAALGA